MYKLTDHTTITPTEEKSVTKAVKKAVKKKAVKAKQYLEDEALQILVEALLAQVDHLFGKVDELEERVDYLEGEKLAVRFENFLYRVGIKKD